MKTLGNLIRRDLRLFFKDKGLFFSSMLTPLILLVLYATFLARVYRDSFLSALPAGLNVSDALIDGTVAAQLASSLLAVSCVTVAFCSNLLMIQDKASGTIRDLTVSPVRRSTISAAYYAASALSTLAVTFTALAACLIYMRVVGWYMSATDVVSVILDTLLLTLFGTALSSCINFFLSTSAQASAVGTIVSAGYGFLCGAYMPISSFGIGLQHFLSFMPGTYGTSLLRNHMLAGIFREMSSIGFPDVVVSGIGASIDCSPQLFDRVVSVGGMYAILGGAIILFTALYILFGVLAGRHASAK